MKFNIHNGDETKAFPLLTFRIFTILYALWTSFTNGI